MEHIDFSILFVLGISIFGGLIGATLFQKMRIPQVVGYIVIGVIAGESGLKLVSHETVARLQPFTLFALGVIGFLVGGELKAENFRKYARQFIAILLGEGLGAFLLVGAGVTIFVYGAFHNLPVAVACGLVFGAIASATDPASTIDVLWEYRAMGVLTTSLTAVVALDDALAMTLYGLGTGAAEILAGGSASIIGEMGKVGLSLLGAVVSGAICAMVLRYLLKRMHQPEKCLSFAIGLILLLISMAVYLDIDVILTSMTLGCVLVNILPKRSGELFKIMRSFSTPIYVLFFVLAGARLGIAQMPGWLWWIVLIYVVGRSAGKLAGTYIGGRISGSSREVRNYLGFGLFAQGGVAIGLSIMASHHLSGVMVEENLALGDVIIFGVAATTLVVQIIGPPMVKLAIKLSGEAGRNVTREDIIKSWKVRDVMDREVVLIGEDMPLTRAAEIFMASDDVVYPVVNRNNNIVGVLSLNSLKGVLTDQDSWRWLLASDVMIAPEETTVADAPLQDVMERMVELNIDEIPVVENGNIPVGMVDKSRVRSLVDKEVIIRPQPETMKKYRSPLAVKQSEEVRKPSQGAAGRGAL
jgi:Kef-type K+ transport system membrane component KefB